MNKLLLSGLVVLLLAVYVAEGQVETFKSVVTDGGDE
jgi:hypothetical protein